MIRLALLRHGHTEWNRAGRIQGRSDIPLDDMARHDLRGLGLPAEWDGAKIWSSPLLRASETAKLISGRAPARAPELTEMDWGHWEGLHGLDLEQQPGSGHLPIERWGWTYCPHGGETPKAVWERVRNWISVLENDAVAVCHIGVMRVILARAHGWDFDGPAPFQIKRNRLYTMTVENGKLTPAPDPIRLIRKAAPA